MLFTIYATSKIKKYNDDATNLNWIKAGDNMTNNMTNSFNVSRLRVVLVCCLPTIKCTPVWTTGMKDALQVKK